MQDAQESSGDRKMWGGVGGGKLSGNTNGCESPKPTRKQLGSSSEESLPKVNGDPGLSELEVFKQDILREMRKEINKMKQEIIDGKF